MEKTLEQYPATCLKVVLFGPESSGKTTLSRQLAKFYNTIWIPEFARDYLQEKWDRTGTICGPEDLLPIAEGQIALENNAASKAKKILFCDTDLLETKVYSEAYYGFCDPLLEQYALSNTYDLYLLTDIDVPWEPDDLRDRPDRREEMFLRFKEALVKYDRHFITLSGNEQKRLNKATNHINTNLF
ncbi:MAG: ATP-binding protein [Leeuwenhoekiella sp.]